MAVDTSTGEKDVRFRTVTLALRVDKGCTKELIEEVFRRWYRGIKGGAYILHDKDVYVEKEVKDINSRIEKDIQALKDAGVWTQEAEDEARKEMVAVGDHKPDHWHILIDFGKGARSAASIATMFHTTPNMVMQVRGRQKGFANMLAYFTHITPQAMEDGKHEYDPSEVRGLIFPELTAYEDFKDYNDFAQAYLEGKLTLDATAKDVLEGKMTVDELMKKDPEYFLRHETMIRRARLNYINSLPTPAVLWNYFIGTGSSDREGTQGRIGKGLMCRALAISHLTGMFPDIDFFSMTDDELKKKGYIYWTGGTGVEFQGYDGQPIVIWEDCRGYDLIKAFKGVNQVYKALDTHPKPIGINIKYGEIYLKNSIFIFDGAQSYSDFIADLSVAWHRENDEYGREHNVMQTKEDKSQAKGRFPFIVEITPSTISATAQLEYLLGTKNYNFRHTFKNDLALLARTDHLELASKEIGDKFVTTTKKANDALEAPIATSGNLLAEISEDEADELKAKDGVETSKELAEVRGEFDARIQRQRTGEALASHGWKMNWLMDEDE